MPYRLDPKATLESKNHIVINFDDGRTATPAIVISKAHKNFSAADHEKACQFGVLVSNAVNDKMASVTNGGGGFDNPVAKSLSDLVTAKQVGMIRALAREIGVDADEECFDKKSCKTDELSKRAASDLITHLQELQKEQNEFQ